MPERRKKSEITKLKIKEAAKILFAGSDFTEVSISDITKQAGYAVGSFYKHWKRKEDLLFELWYEITTEYMLESAHSFSKIQTVETFSTHVVDRVLAYNELSFIQKYFSAHYSLETNDEQIMSAAYTLYVENIYQQLLFIHGKEKDKELWQKAIAVASLLNGHLLNANRFRKNSLAILKREQLIQIVDQLFG